MNINCINCNENNSDYYVCLICGSKICKNRNCVFNNKSGIEDYSLFGHSKLFRCGNGLFISNSNSEIVYLLKRQIINSRIYVYLTLLGESITKYNNNDSDFLNEEQLKRSIQIFIDMSFRKKNVNNYK